MDWNEIDAVSAPPGLLHNESGGRLTAYNDEVGAGGVRGHGGRAQMGAARLQDAARAGVIPEMSPAEYAKQPEAVQSKVEAWHFNDLARQFNALGLDRYYGQDVGGVKVTPNALLSMAHLGGVGGVQKFLSSGGSYNPSDAFGTSLRDYGQRFGGASRETPSQPVTPQPMNRLAQMQPPRFQTFKLNPNDFMVW